MQAPGLKQGLLELSLEFTPIVVGPLDPRLFVLSAGTQDPGGAAWGGGLHQ